MAHKKAGGSTALGRDSAGRRLGVKLTDGEWAKAGSIIIRQRGTKYHPGLSVKKGKDDTLFALKGGFVKFTGKKMMKFDGSLKSCKIVNIVDKRVIIAKEDVAKIVAKKATVKKVASK